MKRWICALLCVLMLLTLCSCGSKPEALKEMKDPVYIATPEGTMVDRGSFTIVYPDELAVMVQKDAITDGEVFLQLAVITDDTLVGSNMNIVRSEDMAGGDAKRISERDAFKYAKACVGEGVELTREDVQLEHVQLGDRNMAVIRYAISYNSHIMYMQQYILMLDDCGYVFTLAGLDEQENPQLRLVMESLTLRTVAGVEAPADDALAGEDDLAGDEEFTDDGELEGEGEIVDDEEIVDDDEVIQDVP
ncbi:MAG: hypothetical protein IJP03_04640 [Christensenellaceae bacterium]|nr:hypothetical protein [Christensenellaceae bacterium]